MKIHGAHIKNIRQANEEGRLAIFVGAGISKSSENDYFKLPLWEDLIRELKADLAVTEELDYLKLAQLYFLEFGEPKYYQTLKEYFPDDIPPSNLHRKILELEPHVIMTTNWDCIVESAIENEGYLYDTISTDKDLVKSTSQKKFIKIHGDFKSHNIVFKEDDYLNYSRNFPLIENYIKSIFSTHTVLFLGYSYNDINLKHIMKWIQSHSNFAPSMYLVAFKSDRAQESYLSSHGITTLVLEESRNFGDCSQVSKDKSVQIKLFLETIMQGEKIVAKENKQEVIEFLYERIKHLKSQNAVSYHQIRKAITNCGFRYDSDGLSVLELYGIKGALTTETSQSQRLLHDEFMGVLADLNKLDSKEKESYYQKHPALKEIFDTLALANIKGIVLPDTNNSGSVSYILNDFIDSSAELLEKDRQYLSFVTSEYEGADLLKSLATESYMSFECGNYEHAFKKNEELIKASKKHRAYSSLLIALFNKNSILRVLKYSFASSRSEKFSQEEEAELQDELFKFPKNKIKTNQVLYDFLSLLLVYQQANECSQKILDLTRAVESIKSGGVSFNNYADEPTYKHMNLLMFALKNKILIDNYGPYKSLMRDFVKISILRKSVKNSVELNQYEIYSAIKFFTTKELKSEFRVFTKQERGNQLRLAISERYTEWVVSTVLSNLAHNLIKGSRVFNDHGARFENCVRLLAVLKLNDSHVSGVFDIFVKLIASRSVTIEVYEALNSFLAHQHSLFDKEIKPDILIRVLNALIDKITYRNAHGWDHHAVQNNSINNLYGYIQITDTIYDDIERVQCLTQELKNYSLEEQRRFARSLLYQIFTISNNEIKNAINIFIQNTVLKNNVEEKEDLEFELWAVVTGFKAFEEEMIQRLDVYLEEYRDRRKFSSGLYVIL